MKPVMTTRPATWPGAVWVGEIDLTTLPEDLDSLELEGAENFTRARFLIREGLSVRGFVTVGVDNGRAATASLRAEAERLPPGDPVPVTRDGRTISVVMCTKDRTDLAAAAIESLLALPADEVILVDNAPSSRATEEWAKTVTDPRFRRILEPRPGVSRGRATGARASRGGIVVFVDDDIIADRHLLDGIRIGFGRADQVGIVCGMVPSGELRTPTQAWFDQRVTWADSTSARVFTLSAPPADLPLFPFQVGAYGTGACFAMDRRLGEQLGWSDPALGVGTPTKGGEDIDIFVRTLFAGWSLVNEPGAIVWHRHRADLPALTAQAHGYGRGLGAWLTKVVVTPRLLLAALRLVPQGMRRVRALARGADDAQTLADESGVPAEMTKRLGRLEVRSILEGPWAYARSRLRNGRRRRAASADE